MKDLKLTPDREQAIQKLLADPKILALTREEQRLTLLELSTNAFNDAQVMQFLIDGYGESKTIKLGAVDQMRQFALAAIGAYLRLTGKTD